MNINILKLIDGAKSAKGLTVIIDVFRAFSLEAYMFDAGIRCVYPVGKTEIAYELKKDNPNWILAGERQGAILPGFNTGNSPSELHRLDLVGKVVVHTTSAGTQGVANAKNAVEILVCSLVNAKATAEYIRKSGVEEVSLVCMGLEGKEETDEDALCARYIKAIIEGKTIDISLEIERLKKTSGAKFFDPKQASIFPEKDFYMCTQVDKFDFAMRFNGKTIEKVMV